MNALFRRAWAVILFGVTLSSLAISQGDVTNFSGLKGKDLKARKFSITDLRDLGNLQSIVADLIGGGSSKNGKITKVTIVEDRAESLKLSISYEGLKNPESTLVCFAADRKLKKPKEISETNVPITDQEGTVEVVIRMANDTPSGKELKTQGVIIRVGDMAKPDSLLFKPFDCTKSWKRRLSEIQAVPIGQSASLVPPSTGTPPTLILVPHISILKTLPAASSTAKSTTLEKKPIPTIVNPGTARPQIKVNDQFATLHKLDLITANIGLPPDLKSKGAKGPGESTLPLLNEFATDVQGLTTDHILTVDNRVIQDENEASGVWYYLPARYRLFWDSTNGYALKFLYGAASATGDVNTVNIVARLTAAVNPNDVQLLKSLLATWCAANGKSAPDLRPFPFGAIPSCSLKDDLTRYNVPENKITISEGTASASELNVAVTTDPVTKENIQLALTDGLGVNGTIKMQAASQGAATGIQASIPVSMQFGDRGSFGTTIIQRTGGNQRFPFKNETPYPLQLRNVHILKQTGTTFRVYSYTLAETELAPGDQVTILLDRIPAFLDTDATVKKMWLDYAVLQDPEASKAAVFAATGGVSNLTQEQIRFNTLTIRENNIAQVEIQVRSKYFDSRGTTVTQKVVLLTADNTEYRVGPVFLINRTAGDTVANDPLYEFRLRIIFADGTDKTAKTWTKSDNLNVPIGSAQIKKVVDEPPTGLR